MKTLKEYFNAAKKEDIYKYYIKIISKPKDYNKISRNEMYQEITNLYQEDPEIILRLCSMEEISVLRTLINKNLAANNSGYIEYVLFNNLKKNFLILENIEYYIPKDILNYVKMALNVLDEKEYSLKDITDSVLIGLIRIYNVLSLEELKKILEDYYIFISLNDLKKQILENPKLKDLITVLKYKKIEYVVSLENFYYKDVLTLQKENIKIKKYVLEEVLSVGKYKINLFKEEIFKFLSFLEMHLDRQYIAAVINDLTVYMGFDINDDEVLKKIADNIEELYNELKKVGTYFPIWVYKGNDLFSLKNNMILPAKNEPCICGSGKKFKRCCFKYYK